MLALVSIWLSNQVPLSANVIYERPLSELYENLIFIGHWKRGEKCLIEYEWNALVADIEVVFTKIAVHVEYFVFKTDKLRIPSLLPSVIKGSLIFGEYRQIPTDKICDAKNLCKKCSSDSYE